MYSTPPRRLSSREWVVVGRRSAAGTEIAQSAPRAMYLFQSRIKHVDVRRNSQSRQHRFDYTFPINLGFKDTEFFRKFPMRRVPMSVRSKRPVQESLDILGTQLMYIPNKRVVR
jgi:hypothetical protein